MPSARDIPRRLGRRIIGALPAPRDESAVLTLRSLAAFLRGSQPPKQLQSAGPRPAPKRPSMNSLAGRWVRVTHGEAPTTVVQDREPSDPQEAAAVRAGWLLIDAYERLSTKAAAKVFGHELAAWQAYADDTLTDLASPEGRIMVDIEQSPANRLRYRRTMDFAQPGDHVFDVGFGRGYLAAQLIWERGVARYRGIDIVDTWVADAHLLLEANGLADADIGLEAGDLFDLTREKIASTGAGLVICCEVLEHVPDAEHALRVLAEALPDGADLLFSVPLHGRLEQVWGHVTVFDVARLKHMLAGAGLYAHHVEPLANTWSLIVASRDPEPSARVRDASRRPTVSSSVPLVRQRRFVDVAAEQMAPLDSAEGVSVVEPADDFKVSCSVTTTGGVQFPVDGLESLRLAFWFTDCDDVEQIDVIARSRGKQVTSWSWKPAAEYLTGGTRRVWFRAGEASTGIVAGPHGRMLDVDTVEVVVSLAVGRTASLGLAAAYLP
jgi:2-polyprenyl-3-methyl-5-hydroxy-6-metoxy-1,4-benzoquinol methylase